MRAFYPVFRRWELAASWRYRTKQAGLVVAITPLLDQLQALGFHLSAETRKLILDLASESL